MAKDHFVARTYLKHFADSTGKLHGYRKPAGEYFPCLPQDVCHEWDGDVIADFAPDDPDRIGRYRKIFEPAWNASIDSLINESLTNEGRFAIAAYVANLLFCTPTTVRIGQEHRSLYTAKAVKFQRDMRRKHGVPVEPGVDDAIAALDAGRIVIEVEADFIKAKASRRLLDHAISLYHQDWTLLENTTADSFITSDYPVAFDTEQNFRSPLTRFLPITPTRCLSISMNMALLRAAKNDKAPIEERLNRAPIGTLRSAKISAKHARRVNDFVSKCAELYVFSNRKSDAVERLCKANGHYEVAFDSMSFRSQLEDSELHAMILTVREKKGAPKRPIRRSAKANR